MSGQLTLGSKQNKQMKEEQAVTENDETLPLKKSSPYPGVRREDREGEKTYLTGASTGPEKHRVTAFLILPSKPVPPLSVFLIGGKR